MLTALCFLGSGCAILAILSDILGRHGSPRIKRIVESLGRKVWFRRSATPVENLRQACAVVASLFLTGVAVVTNNPVYVALQLMLLASSVLWYIDVASDPIRSESIKTYLRGAIAIGIWIGLEIAGLCPGFHRLGVIGLELLGCGFIVARPLIRDSFCFAGGVLLATYAGLGIIYEPENVAHINWCVLNVIYSVLGAIALVDTIRKAIKPTEVDATAN